MDLSWCRSDQFQIVRRHPPHRDCQVTSIDTCTHDTGLRFLSHRTCRFSSTLRTRYRLHSTADDRLSWARKLFRSVSLFFYSAACDHATNPHFHSTSSQQPEPAQSSDPPPPTVTKLESDSVSGEAGAGHNHRDDTVIKSKREKKPVSISGFKSSPSATSSASRHPGKTATLPASSLIYQDADVGVDLGSTRRAARDRAGFVKPTGVDAPPDESQLPRKTSVFPIVEGARAQTEQKKRTIGGSSGSTQLVDVLGDGSRKKRKR